MYIYNLYLRYLEDFMEIQQQEYYKQFDTHKGVYYTQNERIDELNDRILDRCFPDMPLQPHYDPRPVPTKYSLFPLIDRRTVINEPEKKYDEYAVDKTFAPVTGGGLAPLSGYINNIKTENELRNQYFALQHDNLQGKYIPSTNSELYKVTIVSKPTEQPHKNLFRPNEFDSTPHPNIADMQNIGGDKFFNHTRTQLRNTV